MERDQQDAGGGHDEAQCFDTGEWFAEDERAHQGDQDRRGVVAQSRHRNRGVFVGLEEENPVEAHGDAGYGEEQEFLAHALAAQALVGRKQIEADRQDGEHGPVERGFAGREVDAPHEESNRAEYGHGQADQNSGSGYDVAHRVPQ